VGGSRIARNGNVALITPNPGGGLVPVCIIGRRARRRRRRQKQQTTTCCVAQ